jgi:uncharacterized protein YidB (DUF937 family)/outer membrane protein OmpA-like peptidoglycan-associated protein
MSMFDSIISEAGSKFNLGGKTGTLLSALLAMMTDKTGGGFGGFLEKFNQAGLGDTVASWIGSGSNTPVSNEQLESALGADTIKNIANQAGTDYDTAASATAYMTPRVIDALTPDGVVPQETDLLSRIGGYLTGIGGAALGGLGTAAAMTGGAADKVGATVGNAFDATKNTVGGGINAVGDTAGAVGDKFSGAMNSVSDRLDGDGDGGSMLKWLIPLLLLGLLIVLGYMFCGKSTPVVTTNTNSNANVNKNAVVTNGNSTAKTVDSSFSIKADNGKYVVTGVVPDEATKKQIMDALTAQYGAGNVDFAGLKVDAAAKPFGAGWWANFSKMLPSLKDWKTGELSFVGSAITAASGLPQAAIDQLKSLFGTGWTLPAALSGATGDGERKLTEVSLPDGTKLQAYPGGIEDQLIKFIQSDDYKNGTADTLKEKWFSFDDLNFKFGTTELVPESKRQLDNIMAILKAFPDVKMKIGGYTDKKGDDAANKKLSDARAKAVKAALDKAGVGAQVPEAEGYGEEFAKVPETGSDKEREADRKTSVRLLK